MRSRPDGKRLVFVQDLARHVVYFLDTLDLVSPELYAHGVVRVGRKHIERVSAHAKRAALEFVVVAVVLDVYQFVDDVVALGRLFLIDEHGHAGVIHRRADAVNAAYRGDHDDVAPRKEARRCRMAQFFDLFVNGGVFLNKGVS